MKFLHIVGRKGLENLMEFVEPFQETRVLNETGRMDESASPEWWLSSGGLFIEQGGTGKTIQGSLPAGSVWQQKYARHKPDETDNGYHPQNVFRLITRSRWLDSIQEVDFRMNAYRESASERRNATNGVHFINRYQDQHNLYYAGVRVDGKAVIKKKTNGIYETLARGTAFPGEYRKNGLALIPLHAWMGLRCQVKNDEHGASIILSLRERGAWRTVVQARDDGSHGLVFGEGHAGIRTDFMDVEFDNYRIARSR
ncbi:MAG TPA: hypothetical protein VLJ21_01725 [Candidatus Binatia bacterium]|nr:hypothetical protein [Candidatus Binatia bacterium]